jgi:hypothetical protein
MRTNHLIWGLTAVSLLTPGSVSEGHRVYRRAVNVS